jgi:excisionase family DNA binding protein
MNEVFSTRELARLCGVNESTIKRWADSGKLTCVKTPGGHRKFRLREVLAFLNEYGFEGLGVASDGAGPFADSNLTVGILRRDWESLSRAFLETAMQGTAPDVVRFLFRLAAGGCSVVDICDRVVAPGLEFLGREWGKGDVSILQEHLVSAATIHGLERLRETLPHQEPLTVTALCAPMEGDEHEIGVRMTALLLETLGWTVRLAIDSTPATEVAAYIRRERPTLVCISAVSVPLDDLFLERLRRIHQSTREAGSKLAVGGWRLRGVQDLPADLVATDLTALDEFAKSLTGRRGVSRSIPPATPVQGR